MYASIYIFNAEHIPVKLLLSTNAIVFTAENLRLHLVNVVN